MFIPFLLACPLSLGLGDGRIRDEQLSASSKLDDMHAAKQGRASLIVSSYDRYGHNVDKVPRIAKLGLNMKSTRQGKSM